MGDRIVHDGVYDAEGHLVSRDEALRPLDPKGSKRFGRVRRRHNFTWFWLLVVVGLAGWGLWALAQSIEHSENFAYVPIGETRANVLQQLGTPCKVGHVSGFNGQVNSRQSFYFVWPEGSQWDLMVFAHPNSKGSGNGFAVVAKFTAYRGPHTTDYCTHGVTQSPYNGHPWVPTN
jgi:hypothetical protein